MTDTDWTRGVLAVALAVAPVSGWFVVGLLYLQAAAVVTTLR